MDYLDVLGAICLTIATIVVVILSGMLIYATITILAH